MSEIHAELADLRADLAGLHRTVAVLRADAINYSRWIKYLDGQRSHAMDTLDAIKTRMDGMEAATARIAAEFAGLKSKLDAASIEDPRLSAIADHAAAILDKLNAVVPAPVEAVADPVAEQPVEQPAQ